MVVIYHWPFQGGTYCDSILILILLLMMVLLTGETEWRFFQKSAIQLLQLKAPFTQRVNEKDHQFLQIKTLFTQKATKVTCFSWTAANLWICFFSFRFRGRDMRSDCISSEQIALPFTFDIQIIKPRACHLIFTHFCLL